jgi:hypothetical protein
VLTLSITSTLAPLDVFPYVMFNVSPSAIANQESLSGLEVEMRKLEGIVKEIVDEVGYLKSREERFANTNGTY